jgi:hypothetical protein
VLFGTVRGLAVLLGRGITTPARLASFHRRFALLEPMSRRVIVAMEVAVASAVAGVLWPPAAAAVVAVAAIGWAVGRQVGVPEAQCAVSGPTPESDVVTESDVMTESHVPAESASRVGPASAPEATPALG